MPHNPRRGGMPAFMTMVVVAAAAISAVAPSAEARDPNVAGPYPSVAIRGATLIDGTGAPGA